MNIEWTPVAQKLPNKNQGVVITRHSIVMKKNSWRVRDAYFDDGEFYEFMCPKSSNYHVPLSGVTAWMPKIRPYKKLPKQEKNTNG